MQSRGYGPGEHAHVHRNTRALQEEDEIVQAAGRHVECPLWILKVRPHLGLSEASGSEGAWHCTSIQVVVVLHIDDSTI